MRIGLTMRIVNPVEYHEPRDAISHDWLRLFNKLEWSPVLLPNLHENPSSLIKSEYLDGLILTGGEDTRIIPGGDIPEDASPRDRTEMALLKEAFRIRMPVLGVCRGLQLVWLLFGGRLENNGSENHIGTIHQVKFKNGRTGKVNSFHENLLIPASCPDELEMMARDEGGYVEALRHREELLLAVQWHPERPGSDVELDRQLIRRFFEDREVVSL